MTFEKLSRRHWIRGGTLLAPVAAAVAAFAAAPPGGIEEVKREPNPEKRSDKAVKNAEQKMKEAGIAFRRGDREKMMAALEEMLDSLRLSKTSLEETGKPPRKLAGHYKKAEQGSTRILRLLNDLVDALFAEDRPPVRRILNSVQTLHDGFLMAIMRRK